MRSRSWMVGWVAAVLGLFGVATSAAERTVSVFLELEGSSIADLALPLKNGPQPAAAREGARRRRREIQAQQTAVEERLGAVQARVTGRFSAIANALRVRVPESRLADLATLPGVKTVRRAHLYHRHLLTSVPWISAPAVWATAAGGFTGQGVRIGVIDSGIDYLHADFGAPGHLEDFGSNDPTVIEPGSFPTDKVVGGTDFVGDDYNAEDPLNDIPQPDPDPLDTAENGHGTHVAGIAAGVGVTQVGTPYSGSYEGPLDLLIGPGVAPGAQLYALKVFGRTGSTDAVVDGLEWAVDPNGDGDTSDHLDVVVLSLGDTFGLDDPDDIELKAVERLAQLGCVIAISAGNSGNTSYIMGSPGVSARAITVANSIDDGTTEYAIEVTAPSTVAGKYLAEEGTFAPLLRDVGPVTGRLVATNPADACDALANAADLEGNIALINRGTCFFADKTRKAQAAGATAVVFVNNVDIPSVIVMGANGNTSDIKIPAVLITKADGARLRDSLADGVRVTLADGTLRTRPEYADRLDESTSRGPVFRSNRLKPDIAAPGTSIASAKSGSGFEDVVYSGTSMSAPHIAGAAALLKQAHPTWTAEDFKAALMNTAVATHDANGNPYPESLAGAGRVRVDAALRTEVVAKADGDNGEVSVSFGAHELSGPFSTNRTLRVVNHGATPVTLNLSISNTVVDTGITVTPLAPRLTVAAHASATVEVRLDADPAQFKGLADATSPVRLEGVPRRQLPEAEGEIWFQGDGIALHVPWYAVLRATADFHSTVATAGAPEETGVPLPVPTRGTTAHRAPLVTVLQFGASDNSQNYSDERTATDILYTGAASDFATAGAMTNTTLYFGTAMAGHWFTPQRAWYYYDIEIDVINDGRVDYTIANSDSGAFAADDLDSYGDSTDALLTVVRRESNGALFAQRPLGVFEPAFRDTAPFLNGVVLHAVRASDIGLSATRTSFRYRSITDARYSDETSWITFNAARPIVDATPYGLQATPIFDEGRGVRCLVNAANAAGAGTTRLLLLHQHNPAGAQAEVVTVNLTSSDVDGDGLPDAWELANFGDLTYGPHDDPDGDGVDNATELARGTSPFEVRLQVSADQPDTIRWTSPAGRTYTLERAPDLNGEFIALQRHIVALAGTNTFHDPTLVGTHGPFFYRLRNE